MDNTRINRIRLILVGSLTLLSIVTWIALGVYQQVAEDRVTPQVQNELAPLNPTLNSQVLEYLKPRREISGDFPELDFESLNENES